MMTMQSLRVNPLIGLMNRSFPTHNYTLKITGNSDTFEEAVAESIRNNRPLSSDSIEIAPTNLGPRIILKGDVIAASEKLTKAYRDNPDIRRAVELSTKELDSQGLFYKNMSNYNFKTNGEEERDEAVTQVTEAFMAAEREIPTPEGSFGVNPFSDFLNKILYTLSLDLDRACINVKKPEESGITLEIPKEGKGEERPNLIRRHKKAIGGGILLLTIGASIESQSHLIETSTKSVYFMLPFNGMDWNTASRSAQVSIGDWNIQPLLGMYKEDSTAYLMFLPKFGAGQSSHMIKSYDILKPVIADKETLLLILGGKDSRDYQWGGLADFHDGIITATEESNLRKLVENYNTDKGVTKRFIFAASDLGTKRFIFADGGLSLDSYWPNWGIDLRARFLDEHANDPKFKELYEIVKFSPTINNELLLGYASGYPNTSSNSERKTLCENNPDINFATVAVNAHAFGIEKTKIEDQVDGKIVDLADVRDEIVKLAEGNLESKIRPYYFYSRYELRDKLEFFNDALDFVNKYMVDKLKGRGDEVLHIVDFSGGAENASPRQDENTFVGTFFGNAPDWNSFKGKDKFWGPTSRYYALGAIKMYEVRKKYDSLGIKVNFDDNSVIGEGPGIGDVLVKEIGEEYEPEGSEPRTVQWKKWTLVGGVPEDIVRTFTWQRFRPNVYAQSYEPLSVLLEEGFPYYPGEPEQIMEKYVPWNWYKKGELFVRLKTYVGYSDHYPGNNPRIFPIVE